MLEMVVAVDMQWQWWLTVDACGHVACNADR